MRSLSASDSALVIQFPPRSASPAPPADQLTFTLRTGGEVAIDLSGLADEEKARVVAFVRERLTRRRVSGLS